MALDADYIAAYSFEEIILDKDDAFPLANGLVYFYKDQARSELKNIFQLVSSPSYHYVALPNPVKLSSIGTFQDIDGNDIVPYFYPYDETGALELYYARFYSSADGIIPNVFQFDREALPSSAVPQGGDTALEVKNYIPDGQFLLHTNVPTSTGAVTSDITILSQGGWTFERSAGATSTDIVQFNPIYSVGNIPTGCPKFTCNCICVNPDIAVVYKALRVKFYDVNKFASNTQYYTICFTAKCNGGVSSIDINLIKNFGTGGSPDDSTSTPIASDIVLTLSDDIYNFSFLFGTNVGKTLGTNQDDFLQIEFSYPASSSYNIEITDVALVKGDVKLTAFPLMANDEMLSRSLAGWADIPKHNGSNLYLPVMLTPEGLSYDTSVIGKIEATYSSTLCKGELWTDGAKYKTSDYSTDGIPYARLQAVLWHPTKYVPRSGTGDGYMTSAPDGAAFTTNKIMIINNSTGSVPNASNGTISTTFTISNICSGSGSYAVISNMPTSNSFYIEDVNVGAFSLSMGTSGFSGSAVVDGADGSLGLINVAIVYTIAASGLAGKYFSFTAAGAGPQYIWYTVDSAGSDPAPGGLGIKVDLIGADSNVTVAMKTSAALNAFHATHISTVAGNVVPAGSWFNVYTTPTVHYYVWYKVDGVGTEPTVSGGTGIPVEILSTDTNIQVAQKTHIAINSMYFAVPDLRGMILRGRGGSINGWDSAASYRYSRVPGLWGDVVGGYEHDTIIAHNHTATSTFSSPPLVGKTSGTKGATAGGSDWNENVHPTVSTTVAAQGQFEVIPRNIAVEYIIKY